MYLTRILARLAINTNADDLPQSAYAAGRKMTLDSLACAVGGAREPGCNETVELMKQWSGHGEASILFAGSRVPLPNAVFANSAMTHALDYDDVYIPASLHVTSVLFPAVLGAAEHVGASGREFLVAFILGVEVSCRLGVFSASKRLGEAFLPTSVICGFGATAAVCRLLGLTEEQTAHALGINYAQACGNRQALKDMTLTKRLQPAFAARNAVWAACLARADITGPHRAIEGSCGLFGTYLKPGAPTPEELARRPEETWQIERLSIKRYTTCGASHSLIDAALALARENHLKCEDLDRAEISWGGSDKSSIVGFPFVMGDTPQVNAQFSAPYAVALALYRHDASAKRFTETAIRNDTEVAEFASRVHMVKLPEPPAPLPIPEGWPQYTGMPHTVQVILKNGARLRRDVAPRDTFNPDRVTWQDVIAKLDECAEISGGITATRYIVEMMGSLEQEPSICNLIAALQ